MNRVRIKVTSTFTVEPLSPYLAWWFSRQNIEPVITVAPYHGVFQELISESEEGNTHFCYCIRFEDYIRHSKKSPSEQIEILSQTFDSLCNLLSSKRFKTTSFVALMPLRQNVLDSIVEKHIRNLNECWFAFLSDRREQGLIAVDLRQVATQYDVKVVFDVKSDEIGHIPYSEKFFCAAGSVIAKKILVTYQRPFKVIVVDADNTLWEGLCGEEASYRLRITDAHQAFHRFLIGKVNSGYLLALVSKNNEGDVFNVFECNERLLLRKDHFVSFKINWNRKSDNISALARDLNLMLDCFCFLDDSPTECSEVNLALPEVLAIQMPCEIQIPDFLDRLWFLDKFSVTAEDRARTVSYQAEIKRTCLRQEVTFEEFLKQIDIKITFGELQPSELERASQLTLRTNQFNSSGKRRNVFELGLLLKAGYVIWSVNVSDLYGDYGFSGLVIGLFENNTLRVDTFLLSCRVLGKEIEYSILYALKEECIARGIDIVLIDFYPSPKNQPFSAFLNKRVGNLIRDKDGYSQHSIAIADIPENINHTLCTKRDEVHVSTVEKRTIPPFRFHHVALAVKKIEDARVIFGSLNYQSSEPVFDEHQKVMLSMCTKPDDTPVELVGPVNDRSPITHILKKNGETPYHLCFQVVNFDKAFQYLTASQVEFNIVKDAYWAILFNAPVMFIHVKDVGLIELVELKSNAVPLMSPSVLIQMVTPNIESLSRFFNAIGYQQGHLVSGSCSFKSKYHTGIEVIPEYSTTPEARMFLQNNGAYVFRLKIIGDKPVNIDLTPPSYISYVDKNLEIKASQDKWEWSQLLPINVDLFHTHIYKALSLTTVDRILKEMNGEIASVQQIETGMSETGQKLCRIWKEVLKTRNDYTGQTFFELGGHSLLATQILSRIHDEFNVDFSLTEFFDHPTISEVAQLIDDKVSGKSVNHASYIVPAELQETYSLSNAQKRIWFLHQASEDTSFNNMIRAYRMKGPVNYKTFDVAFSLLIQRHESLRTVFILKNDEPRQRILNAGEIGFSVQYFDYTDLRNKSSRAEQLQRETALFNFDLEKGPLFLVRIIKLDTDDHIFLLTIHHIITDGWSMGVLFTELCSFYKTLRAGDKPNLSPPKIQYKDYALWANKLAAGYKDYWINCFRDKDELPYIQIPGDYLRPAHKTFEGNVVSFGFDAKLTEKVREFSQQHVVSVFVTLTAIFNLLLYSQTGLTDLIFGTPTAGRMRSELENQVGVFINTLALRVRFKVTDTFSQLLQNINRVIIQANDFQLYPFDQLLDDLGAQRFSNRSPLFETGITWQSHNELDGEIENVSIAQIEGEKVMSQHDFWLLGSPNPDGMVIDFNFVYNTALFNSDTIVKLKNDFMLFTEQALNSPLEPIGSLVESALLRNIAHVPLQDMRKASLTLDDNF